MLAAAAAPAAAQYSAPKLTGSAIGEKYHIQASAGLWNPDLTGVIASEQFGITGSKVDFVTDLKFQKTRFSDFRFELKPSKHNKLYAQYSPVSYSSDTTTTREIIFNGQKYSPNVPIQATFDWKVWRIGYEIDVLTLPRGFVGLMFEGRLTDFGASLRTPGLEPEFTRAKGPLPAVGFIARGYVLANLSITGSISGFKVPNVSPDYKGNYYDLDIYGTFNVVNWAGVQAGYRDMSTTVTMKKDFGDMRYKGVWFGGVLRY
jgi:hypothetical protein